MTEEKDQMTMKADGRPQMNASELAQALLEWEEKKIALDKLEAAISAAVLKTGKTQNVGNVRATFSKGRRVFDYETAAVESPYFSEGAKSRYTVIPPTPKAYVDWKKLCEHLEIDEFSILKQGASSVRIKLLE